MNEEWSTSRRVRDTLRYVIISPEFAAFLAAVAVGVLAPHAVELVAGAIMSSEHTSSNIFLWIAAGAPVVTVRFGVKLLFPGTNHREYIESPIYDAIRSRVVFAAVLGVAAVVLTVIEMIAPSWLPVRYAGAAYLGIISAAWISAGTVVYAYTSVRSILEVSSQDSKIRGGKE